MRIRGAALIVVIVLASAIYAAMVTVTLPELARMAGGRMVFDLMATGYDADHARVLLATLGEEGRHYYLTRQIPLDAVYPALLALSLSGSWRYLLDQLDVRRPSLTRLGGLPVLAGAFDYGENGLIVRLLLDFSDATVVAWTPLASALTVAKSATTTLCFIGLGILGGALLWRRYRRP